MGRQKLKDLISKNKERTKEVKEKDKKSKKHKSKREGEDEKPDKKEREQKRAEREAEKESEGSKSAEEERPKTPDPRFGEMERFDRFEGMTEEEKAAIVRARAEAELLASTEPQAKEPTVDKK